MSAPSEYERFADIYAVWTATAASAQANRDFYVDAYVAADGPVVELGVGDGRIAVEAAVRGRTMIGVDLSPAMLRLCRDRAARAGVSDRVSLIEADFRSFTLPEPAALIALPYHSLGHLQSLEAKRDAVRHIHTQLRPGGRFIFDDFVMTPEQIDRMRRVQLRAQYRRDDGREALLWVTSLVDVAAQTMRVVTWEDDLDADGALHRRQYRQLSLSWLEPAQARALLEDNGFVVDACWGSFDRAPFAPASAQEQIWIARKDSHR
ncbi:MAG: methyltransferase domain-containing protein [Acidobacteria bacterium]|nr:methyltransferase domain-containing protein [Acidobacteriota bacterium]